MGAVGVRAFVAVAVVVVFYFEQHTTQQQQWRRRMNDERKSSFVPAEDEPLRRITKSASVGGKGHTNPVTNLFDCQMLDTITTC